MSVELQLQKTEIRSLVEEALTRKGVRVEHLCFHIVLGDNPDEIVELTAVVNAGGPDRRVICTHDLKVLIADELRLRGYRVEAAGVSFCTQRPPSWCGGLVPAGLRAVVPIYEPLAGSSAGANCARKSCDY